MTFTTDVSALCPEIIGCGSAGQRWRPAPEAALLTADSTDPLEGSTKMLTPLALGKLMATPISLPGSDQSLFICLLGLSTSSAPGVLGDPRPTLRSEGQTERCSLVTEVKEHII